LDYIWLKLLGVEMWIGTTPATLLVVGTFALSLGAVGYVVGRLLHANHELATTEKKVAHYEKLAAIGRMAAGVAHEVRNPLGVIRGSAAHIKEELDPEKGDAFEACEFIVEEVDRLNAFITELLDFSRPLQPHVETVAAREIVDRALSLADDRLGEGVTVDVDISDELQLKGDPDLLARVLLGLIINGVDAMDGAGTLTVGAATDGRQVWLDVRDTGPGVSKEHRGQLFEPFFTTKADGTGLGLAMAQKVAEAHGGVIALVDSDVGAAFRLRLKGAAV